MAVSVRSLAYSNGLCIKTDFPDRKHQQHIYSLCTHPYCIHHMHGYYMVCFAKKRELAILSPTLKRVKKETQ
jgi:hypothetical protein